MSPPSRKMKLGEVPRYIYLRKAFYVTRQTVYNWVKNGKQGQKLRTISVGGVKFTTERWINEFLANIH